jgi:hypothetical protein
MWFSHCASRAWSPEAIAALAGAAVTALFLGGRTEQEQEIAMIEHGEDAAVA